MSRVSIRLAVILSLLILIAAPALAWHKGPPADDNGDDPGGEPTWRVGCSCHNAASTSDRIYIEVFDVPPSYNASGSYEMTVKLTDLGGENKDGGFMLTTEEVGSFSWSETEMLRPFKGFGNATDTTTTVGISQSDLTNPATWTFTWIAPESDVGSISFWVAGNIVDGGGAPDNTDYWKTMSFTVRGPSEAPVNQSRQVISSTGDYAGLYGPKDNAAAEEQARQDALSENVMDNGVVWFFTSLVALIIGGVLQREILERKHGTGPSHLDKQLAYPEGLRRGLLSLGLALLGLYWLDNGAGAYMWTTAMFCSAWAAYGVYRTVLAARTPPTVMDLL